MKKNEAEGYIRRLAVDWRNEPGRRKTSDQELRFSDFWDWLCEGYPQVLSFRTSRSVRDDVELWFDDVFRQSWMR